MQLLCRGEFRGVVHRKVAAAINWQSLATSVRRLGANNLEQAW